LLGTTYLLVEFMYIAKHLCCYWGGGYW